MSVDQLRQLREAYRKTPDSYVHELRLSFAEVVVDRLQELGWNQKTLSDKLGVTEPLISRLLSGDHNWTSESAGRLLFALGVRARVRKGPFLQETFANAVTDDAVWLFHAISGDEKEIQTEAYNSGQTPEILKKITRTEGGAFQGGPRRTVA